jgi:ArsR family transcriptional regulator, arsenate/arsenite/antimonite-responsive transcriptional repressor
VASTNVNEPPSTGAAVTDLDVLPVACCAPLSAGDLSAEEATATAALFKALSDPHRVRIVNLLVNSAEAVCVCDLTEPLGLAQPTVSHHLKKLLEAGLLQREKRGVWSYYSLDDEAMQRLAAVAAWGGAR